MTGTRSAGAHSGRAFKTGKFLKEFFVVTLLKGLGAQDFDRAFFSQSFPISCDWKYCLPFLIRLAPLPRNLLLLLTNSSLWNHIKRPNS